MKTSESDKVEPLIPIAPCLLVSELSATLRLRASIVALRLTPEEFELLCDLVAKTINSEGGLNPFTVIVPRERLGSLARLLDFGLASEIILSKDRKDGKRRFCATVVGASCIHESVWGSHVE